GKHVKHHDFILAVARDTFVRAMGDARSIRNQALLTEVAVKELKAAGIMTSSPGITSPVLLQLDSAW
ncbi:Hypothetical predicted protein, partial [Pelobates cultripes]